MNYDPTGTRDEIIRASEQLREQLAIEREKAKNWEENALLYAKNVDFWKGKLDAAKGDAKHYRELFDEIRQALGDLIPTDASKKEIIDCVKSLRRQLDAAVDVMKEVRDRMPYADKNPSGRIIDAWLAKVKEGK